MAEAPLSALLSAMGGVLLYPLVGLQWVAAARTAHTAHAPHTRPKRCGALRRAAGPRLVAAGSWLPALDGGRTPVPPARRPSRPNQAEARQVPRLPNPKPKPKPKPKPIQA